MGGGISAPPEWKLDWEGKEVEEEAVPTYVRDPKPEKGCRTIFIMVCNGVDAGEEGGLGKNTYFRKLKRRIAAAAPLLSIEGEDDFMDIKSLDIVCNATDGRPDAEGVVRVNMEARFNADDDYGGWTLFSVLLKSNITKEEQEVIINAMVREQNLEQTKLDCAATASEDFPAAVSAAMAEGAVSEECKAGGLKPNDKMFVIPLEHSMNMEDITALVPDIIPADSVEESKAFKFAAAMKVGYGIDPEQETSDRGGFFTSVRFAILGATADQKTKVEVARGVWSFRPIPTPEYLGNTHWGPCLEMMEVHPAFRKKGVGTFFYQHMEKKIMGLFANTLLASRPNFLILAKSNYQDAPPEDADKVDPTGGDMFMCKKALFRLPEGDDFLGQPDVFLTKSVVFDAAAGTWTPTPDQLEMAEERAVFFQCVIDEVQEKQK
mmetsp:Transcript_24965/g.41606  ORF Transcript_24965/g.41606 Transcript_24965/m.41606 type:complete len:434 (-) Transcript_24965:365-1666(-)